MSGSTLTIILSFISGIFSLVGLMSIFISMNSQHNVQRSRELLWDLAALPYKKNIFTEKGAIGKEVFRKFMLYEQILNEKHDFSHIIIRFAQIALGFCVLVWSTMAIDHMENDRPFKEKIYLICGLLLSLSFALYFIFKILGDLKGTSKVGRLPTVPEIIDADRVNQGLNVVTLAAISSCLRLVDSKIYLGFPLPFRNLRINLAFLDSMEEALPITFGTRANHQQCLQTYKKLELNEFVILDDDYCWYPVNTLKISGKRQKGVLVTLEITSQQGLVNAEFYIEEFSEDNETSLNIFPYSFSERFINRVSALDPFSIYGDSGDTSTDSSAQEAMNASTCGNPPGSGDEAQHR
jgi:hypothetical protein